MARPAEKARAMLNKWVKMREQGNEDTTVTARKTRRPHLASECEHLSDAEYYRSQIIREISTCISKIQNPGLGEHTLRELNDEINKLMRTKYHWNKRIKELGGVDYNLIERKRQIEEGDTDSTGQHVQPGHVYRYYGAAKDLPGVREVLTKQEAKWKKKNKKASDLHKRVTPDYFGWRDEEDGVLIELEAQQIKSFNNKRQKLDHKIEPKNDGDNDQQKEDRDYLDVPSPQVVSQILLEHKKKALLARFSV